MTIYSPPPGPPPTQYPQYDPPPGPPPSRTYYHPPSLLPTDFPLLSGAEANKLSTHGYTTLPIAQRPALFKAATSLFDVSRAFFAQPESHKSEFQVRTANVQGSEEGWSRIEGEKELITIRRGGATVCPPSVEGEVRDLWKECGVYMQEAVHCIEHSLNMSPGALDDIVNAECVMPEAGSERHETLLRMFRYERHPEGGGETQKGKGRLVAEAHYDLGLLSLVIGASPGLEVWDGTISEWVPIEEPPHAHPGSVTATLLIGETLMRLTNARYRAGRHRVFVPPPASEPFRYSLVFALRPHTHAVISTAALTTNITGTFFYPLDGVRARDFFKAMARAHWNVNTGVATREAQRQKLWVNGTTEETEKTEEADGVESVDKKKRWSLGSRSLLLHKGERNPWTALQRILRL